MKKLYSISVPEGALCQPNPCGPNSDCRVIGGRPTCFCLPSYIGNPPESPCKLPTQPCNPSPCGPNTLCSIVNGYAKCTCIDNYIEHGNTINGCVVKKNPCEPNPCGEGAVCDTTRNPPCYCPVGTIGNSYYNCSSPTRQLCRPGPCGPNAECYTMNDQEICKCKTNFLGNPYEGCTPNINPCLPSPCGFNTDCSIQNGRAVCSCRSGYKGHPVSAQGCQPECSSHRDCPSTKTCINHHCVDPCPGACGIDAECKAQDHRPVCFCPYGLSGDPYLRCVKSKPSSHSNIFFW